MIFLLILKIAFIAGVFLILAMLALQLDNTRIARKHLRNDEYRGMLKALLRERKILDKEPMRAGYNLPKQEPEEYDDSAVW